MVFALLHSKFTHAETGLWFKHARTHTHTHPNKQSYFTLITDFSGTQTSVLGWKVAM